MTKFITYKTNLMPGITYVGEILATAKHANYEIGKLYSYKDFKLFCKRCHIWVTKNTLLTWKVFERVENGINSYGNMTYLYKYNGVDNVFLEMKKMLEENYKNYLEIINENEEKFKNKEFRKYFYEEDWDCVTPEYGGYTDYFYETSVEIILD